MSPLLRPCLGPGCRHVVPIEAKDGRCPKCRSAKRSIDNRRRQLRPLRVLYGSRAWQRLREFVFIRDDRVCFYCGVQGPLEHDPLIAAHLDETQLLLAAGGLAVALDAERVVTAHRSCAERNAPSSKGGRP